VKRATFARFAFAGWSTGTFAFYGFASDTFHDRGIRNDALDADQRIRLVLFVVVGIVAALGAARTIARGRGAEAVDAWSHRVFLLAPVGLLPLVALPLSIFGRLAVFALVSGLFAWSLASFALRSPWGAAIEALDVAKPGVVSALVATVALVNAWSVAALAVYRCATLQAGWDLMIHVSLHHNVVTTGRAWTTGLAPHGQPVDHYGNHLAPIEHLSALVYSFHRVPETLVVLQTIVVQSAAFAVYGVVRRLSGSATAGLMLAAGYGMNVCTLATCTYDFHEAAFLQATLLGLMWACVAEKRALVWVFALLTMCSREDGGLWMALFAVVWWSRGKKIGLPLALAGAAHLVLANFVVMPWIRASTGQPMWFFGRYAAIARGGKESVGHIAESVLTNVPFVTSYVFGNEEKWFFFAMLLLPVALLPLRTRRGALLVAPPIAMGVLSTYEAMYRVNLHYTVQIVPFLYLAAALGLACYERRKAIVLATTSLVLTALVCGVWGWHPIVNARFIDRLKPEMAAEYGDRAALYRRLALEIPQDGVAQASAPFTVALAARRYGYLVPNAPDADYGMIDYSKNAKQSIGTTTPKMRRWVVEKLRTGGYGVMFLDDRVVVIGRGRSTERNDEVIERLATLARDEDGETL
jgi:uncharacterized membrane protein